MNRKLQIHAWFRGIFHLNFLVIIFLPLPAARCAVAQGSVFDVVIRHGGIVDGSGDPWYGQI